MSSVPLFFIATIGTLDLYWREDDEWVVQKGSHVCDTVELRARISLLWLPLLEQEYPTFREAVLSGLSSAGPEEALRRWATFPEQELLLLGLTKGGSWYWVDLALSWAAQVGPGPAVLEQVQRLAEDQSVPQPLRHRAKRMYYLAKRNA
jgi:hypothetical protein